MGGWDLQLEGLDLRERIQETLLREAQTARDVAALRELIPRSSPPLEVYHLEKMIARRGGVLSTRHCTCGNVATEGDECSACYSRGYGK